MNNEPDDNPGPEQAVGPKPMPDARAEVMRQIRRALILSGGALTGEDSAQGGFDPYNKRATPRSDSWRVRRRD